MNLDQFFASEVKPALGCTEPGAVALATATAARILPGDPQTIHCSLSVNVFKNGRSVGLPSTPGLRGNKLAAALGALGGDPEKGLMILEDLPESVVTAARKMVEAGVITEDIADNVPSVWVQARVSDDTGAVAECRISGRHDHVERLELNGETVFEAPPLEASAGPSHEEELRSKSFQELWDMAGSISDRSRRFLLEGVRMNMGVADEGMRAAWGMGVGFTAEDGGGVQDRLRRATGAASDVRMSGGNHAVMSSAGSGNHGITAIIPVAVLAAELGKDDAELTEALALSHLVCGYLKAYTGRLTPICGCSVAAGAGAAAGMARLMGGTPEQAERAVVTLVASLLGVICDGAKETCSLRVASAANEAYCAARLAIQGGGVQDTQGLVAPDIHTLGEVLRDFSNSVFTLADRSMARIMMNSQK